MKNTTVRLTAALLSAALAAVCIRVLPDAFSAGTGIRADAAAAQPLTVQIAAESVVPRASEMTVSVQIEGEIPGKAWIGIVPVGVSHTERDSDDHDVSWEWLRNVQDGAVTLNTPNTIGEYEIRCFDADDGAAKEVACIPIRTTYRGCMGAQLSVENRYVAPGSDVEISASLSGEIPGDAWIGFVPSDAGHSEDESDAVNGNWSWAKDISDGGYVIKAPNTEGNYDIRIFDGDSNHAYEVARVPVYVTADEDPKGLCVDLEVPDAVFRNAEIPIRISMTGEISKDAWIAVIPSEVAHTEKDGDDHNGAWRRLNEIENGELTLTAPEQVGNYDIRVYDGEDENTAKEIASQPFRVIYSTMRGKVSTDEAWVKPGKDVTVRVYITGEYPDEAWIAFVPTEIAHTEKDGDDHNGDWCRVKDIQDGVTTLRAPGEEGVYDIRMYDGEKEGAVEVAFCTLTVSKKPPVRSAFEPVSGLDLNDKKGTLKEDNYNVLGWTREGDWALYENLDFGDGASYFTLNGISAYTDSSVELYLDALTGTPVGTLPVNVSGYYGNYIDYTIQIPTVTGVHDLYLLFRSPSGAECSQVNTFVFSKEAPGTSAVVTTAPAQTTTAVQTTVTTVTTVTTASVQAAKLGDVNGDGSIDLKDVTVLRRYLAGGWNAVIIEANSDVNKDGSIDLKDVTVLRRYLAGGWGVTLD
ncbi:MAG: carbohydrate-binding protein [Oscillospiraceae bacterium]|nr:carbohydrate-binding protein [Oscillospiraceae bacterium]